MALTVPKAGVIGGRSANISVVTPDTGATISAFGGAMLEVGKKLRADQIQIDTTRAQLGMTRDMGQARLEVEQLGDPAQIGPAWEARMADIRARYITEGMDPAMAEQLDLSITELSDKHALALSEKSINLGRSQREALWIEARDAVTTDAVSADPETFQALVAMGEAAIDTRVAAGLVDPATAAQEKLNFHAQVYQGRADALIGANPQAFLDQSAKGDWNALGADLLSSRQAMAQKEVARLAAEGVKAGELAARQQGDALKRRLGEMTTLFSSGRKITDEDLLTNPQVIAAATADPEVQRAYNEAMAAKSLRDEMPGMASMTLTEIDAAIAAEQKRPVTQPWEAARLGVLTKARTDVAAQWETNAPAAALAAGMAVPPFDPADPASFASGLAARLDFATANQAAGYTRGLQLFSPDETAALKTTLDPKADVAPKLALAAAAARAGANAPDRVTAAIGADPVFAAAATVIATTGNQALAREILMGQQKAALGNAPQPTDRETTALFSTATGGVFDDNPAMAAQIRGAAMALVADQAARLNPKLSFAEDADKQALFKDAVQRVTGATPDTEGALTVGGIQDINGAMVALPPGIAVAEVETAIEQVDAQLTNVEDGAFNAQGDWIAAPPKDVMRAFRAASIDGSIPELGGADAGDYWQTAQFIRIGNTGAYEMTIEVDGVRMKVARANDPSQGAFRFDLMDLLREAAK